jgi:hypothetical protein
VSTRPDPQHFSSVDTRPLTDRERKLIEAASTRLWGPELHHALLNALLHRGIPVSHLDDCGRLADILAETGTGSS